MKLLLIKYVDNIGFDGSGVSCGNSQASNALKPILCTKNLLDWPKQIEESAIAVEAIKGYYKEQKKSFLVRAINKVTRLTIGTIIILSTFMALFAIISTFNNIFAYFVNGVGLIRLQMYCGIIGMLINIPISIFFAKNLNMGSSGVILGTIFSIFLGSILIPIQCVKLIRGDAKGIWNK
jgi:Na+-driven multidrug efflux pump